MDRLLSRLSNKKRTVLVLFEVEGLRVDEIARIVDCPENTVWSRLHHARSEMLKMAKKGDKAADRIANRVEGRGDGDEGERRGGNA